MSRLDLARREVLLDELVELFLSDGFQSFTVADLAQRLHCSKSTLYGVGHSKEQLTVNVLVRFFRNATEEVERRTSLERDPARKIAAYLASAADALRPASARFMEDVANHPAAVAVYAKNTRFAAERVRELIQAGTEIGAFRTVHAAFVADVVATTMRRIQTGGVEAATGLLAAAAYDELASLVLHGIQG